MPLKKGSSKKTFDKNMSELMSSFRRSGRIGTSKPSSSTKARKQALVIAFDMKKKTKK
jgi:hypothetical protein